MAVRKKTRKRRPISQRGGIIARRKRKSRPTVQHKGGYLALLAMSLLAGPVGKLFTTLIKRKRR